MPPSSSLRIFSRLANSSSTKSISSLRPIPRNFQKQNSIRRLSSTSKPTRLSAFRSIPSLSKTQLRYNSTSSQPPPSTSASSPKPLTDRTPASPSSPPAPARPPQPSYDLTFTCTPCSFRSTHRISKQGYHHGSVLITCPSCRNRHVISDHLKIFGDRNLTIEDLMREQGQIVKKGTLSEDGDVEFWGDGSVTRRERGKGSGEVYGAKEGQENGTVVPGLGAPGEEGK